VESPEALQRTRHEVAGDILGERFLLIEVKLEVLGLGLGLGVRDRARVRVRVRVRVTPPVSSSKIRYTLSASWKA
jgi:hypothetical protein